jgi:hypothetical protein
VLSAQQLQGGKRRREEDEAESLPVSSIERLADTAQLLMVPKQELVCRTQQEWKAHQLLFWYHQQLRRFVSGLCLRTAPCSTQAGLSFILLTAPLASLQLLSTEHSTHPI